MHKLVPETEGMHFEGGCHCGAIRFSVQGPMRQIVVCHCYDCRRLTGSSWSATAVPEDNFEFLSKARPRWYASSSWAQRGFCEKCGANMLYKIMNRPMLSVAAGALDDSNALRVSGQIFADSHPKWGPPGPDLPHLDDQIKYDPLGRRE
jgi:hypothetical protein